MPVLLDTSAVIAYLLDEPGGDLVGEALDDAIIAAPNAAEIVSVLMRRGSSESSAIAMLRQLEVEVIPFDETLAMQTGGMIAKTRHLGLSLGDCACLALGQARGATVMTADRVWDRLDLPVRIQCIR